MKDKIKIIVIMSWTVVAVLSVVAILQRIIEPSSTPISESSASMSETTTESFGWEILEEDFTFVVKNQTVMLLYSSGVELSDEYINLIYSSIEEVASDLNVEVPERVVVMYAEQDQFDVLLANMRVTIYLENGEYVNYQGFEPADAVSEYVDLQNRVDSYTVE